MNTHTHLDDDALLLGVKELARGERVVRCRSSLRIAEVGEGEGEGEGEVRTAS